MNTVVYINTYFATELSVILHFFMHQHAALIISLVWKTHSQLSCYAS